MNEQCALTCKFCEPDLVDDSLDFEEEVFRNGNVNNNEKDDNETDNEVPPNEL
jgi:hypothetical protein